VTQTETGEERRQRIQAKASKHFVLLVALILGLSVYIAFFTGDSFIEMIEHAPTD
jgi:hypothetical protein